MTLRCSYGLDIGISVEGRSTEDLFAFDEVLSEAAGRESVSSGMGFGYRDNQFEFPSRLEAEEAEGRIIVALGRKGVVISENSSVDGGSYVCGPQHMHWDDSWTDSEADPITDEMMYPDDDCPEKESA